MASGSGAGARAAACPTRKERLDLRKQSYVGLRRAMWSARVRLDQQRKKKEEGAKRKEEEHEREEKETEDMMWEDQQHICCWYDHGEEALPEPFAFPPCLVHGVDKNGDVVEVSGDFATAYKAGAIMALAKVPGPEGTTGWTVGKRSDFAKGNVPGFLAAMNELEPGWGGGSTIGGAPRKDGGLRSSLGWNDVWPVFLQFAKG